jgi:hypothetical protein
MLTGEEGLVPMDINHVMAKEEEEEEDRCLVLMAERVGVEEVEEVAEVGQIEYLEVRQGDTKVVVVVAAAGEMIMKNRRKKGKLQYLPYLTFVLGALSSILEEGEAAETLS